MVNKEILADVEEMVLSIEIDHGFSVVYDAQDNPIIVIAPKKKANQMTDNSLISKLGLG